MKFFEKQRAPEKFFGSFIIMRLLISLYVHCVHLLLIINNKCRGKI